MPTPTPALALDLVYGERDAQPCGVCSRQLPAIEKPRFELEDADTGRVLCEVCANRTHHGLRLAAALMNAIADAYHAGDKRAAEETLAAVVSGIELLEETAPKQPYRRPVRHQPVRQTRRGRRR